jgi:hypothetical protein
MKILFGTLFLLLIVPLGCDDCRDNEEPVAGLTFHMIDSTGLDLLANSKFRNNMSIYGTANNKITWDDISYSIGNFKNFGSIDLTISNIDQIIFSYLDYENDTIYLVSKSKTTCGNALGYFSFSTNQSDLVYTYGWLIENDTAVVLIK